MALSDDLTRGLAQWFLAVILLSAGAGAAVVLLARWLFFR